MRVIRLKDVMDTTGLSRSTVYKYIFDGVFPKPITLGERCVGWVESEIHEWVLARIEQRDNASIERKSDQNAQAGSLAAADKIHCRDALLDVPIE